MAIPGKINVFKKQVAKFPFRQIRPNARGDYGTYAPFEVHPQRDSQKRYNLEVCFYLMPREIFQILSDP